MARFDIVPHTNRFRRRMPFGEGSTRANTHGFDVLPAGSSCWTISVFSPKAGDFVKLPFEVNKIGSWGTIISAFEEIMRAMIPDSQGLTDEEVGSRFEGSTASHNTPSWLLPQMKALLTRGRGAQYWYVAAATPPTHPAISIKIPTETVDALFPEGSPKDSKIWIDLGVYGASKL